MGFSLGYIVRLVNIVGHYLMDHKWKLTIADYHNPIAKEGTKKRTKMCVCFHPFTRRGGHTPYEGS